MTRLRKMVLEELQRRNYSKSTARAYLRVIRDFAGYFHSSPDKLGRNTFESFRHTSSVTGIWSLELSSSTVQACGFCSSKRCTAISWWTTFRCRKSRSGCQPF